MQRREGGADKRPEWAQSKRKTPREKRCLGRGQTGRSQNQREKNAALKLTSRKAYLTPRVPGLEQSKQGHKSLIDHLRMNIMQGNGGPVH